MTKKKLPGFKYEKRGEDLVMIKTHEGGAEVRYDFDDGDVFSVYDKDGNYLGWTERLDEADYMAHHGFPNMLEDISDLSLWTMWNDALDCGEKPLEDPTDGTQFLCLRNDIVMSAQQDAQGWEIKLMMYLDFEELYRDEFFPVLRLRVAKKPFRLE